MTPRFADAEEAMRFFDGLDVVAVEGMFGAWRGEEVASGHPLDGALAACGWWGKRFEDAEHVHPLVFGAGGRPFAVRPGWVLPGVPLALRWPALKRPPLSQVVKLLLPLLATPRPRARLRMLQFRGRVSAAMLYDDVPVVDVFRRIDDDTVLGVMDLKGMERPYFFLLRREPPHGIR